MSLHPTPAADILVPTLSTWPSMAWLMGVSGLLSSTEGPVLATIPIRRGRGRGCRKLLERLQ